MPPKKQEGTEDKVWLGKPKNNVKIGLVGLPNVGKSSLFNVFGGLQVAAENYPFCTIEPAKTQVEVPDMRFNRLCEYFKPKSEVKAVLTVTDIAGLVKNAAEGAGLGNEFLSNIQAVDAIYHVTRAFTKKEIEHVEGSVDPVRDLNIIRTELIKKDIQYIEAVIDGYKKKVRSKKNKELEEEMAVCERALALLQEGKEVRFGTWTHKEAMALIPCNLLTAKPVVFLVNISKQNFEKDQNKFFKDIKEWVEKECPGDPIIPYSVTFESDLAAMDEEEKKKYLAELKKESQMPKIIKTGYKALGLMNFFTCGEDEVRAWSVRQGSKAPQAAGVIHGDFEKCFIKAEVYSFKSFKEQGFDEKKVQAAGLVRTKGKDYVVQDGDILFIKHNASK